LQIDQFIENSVKIGQFYGNKGVVLTGPNASGKSVFMHQIAIITFMAHLGSFVPCSYASIEITDKILTRSRTKPSITLKESSFMIDLKQAYTAISQSTEKSLVLIDEFGKGTIQQDGIGLFASIVQILQQKTFKLITATHFYEIFTKEFIDSLTGSTFLHFKMIKVDDRFEFLYELENGLCEKSLGLQCAKMNGFSNEFIKRAFEISEAINNGEPIPCIEDSSERNEAARLVYRIFMKMDLDVDDIEMELWKNLRTVERMI
jgi:DNA mismatch repair protein MSH5